MIKRYQIDRDRDRYADKATPFYARECSGSSLPIGQLETIIGRQRDRECDKERYMDY